MTAVNSLFIYQSRDICLKDAANELDQYSVCTVDSCRTRYI